MRPGVELLQDRPGSGAPVEKLACYEVKLRMWLSRGDATRWSRPWGPVDRARLEDGGLALVTALRVDRESTFPGLFYGNQGMRIGGTRRLRIAPHLAYRDAGVPGVVPPNALLTVEIEVLSRRRGAG